MKTIIKTSLVAAAALALTAVAAPKAEAGVVVGVGVGCAPVVPVVRYCAPAPVVCVPRPVFAPVVRFGFGGPRYFHGGYWHRR